MHIFRNAIATLIATTALPGVADAQYYARQKLHAGQAAPPVYDGTWSSSSSAGNCVAFKRTTTVTGTCTGGTCDPSKNPSTTTESACGASCDTMKAGFISSPSSADPASVRVTGTSYADAIAKAKVQCESATGTTACRFAIQSGDRSGQLVAYRTTDLKKETTTYTFPYDWHYTYCRRP